MKDEYFINLEMIKGEQKFDITTKQFLGGILLVEFPKAKEQDVEIVSALSVLADIIQTARNKGLEVASHKDNRTNDGFITDLTIIFRRASR